MYINEAIERADSYYPNEYDLTEKYLWCDEVSSMLAIEDRRIYRERRLPVSRDGTILLPENVTIEYIDKIIYKNKVLEKQDARTFGRNVINVNSVINNGNDVNEGEYITVIYLVPYEPIRLVKYNGDMQIDTETDTIKIKSCEFITGDTLVIKAGDVTIANVPLLDIEFDTDGEYMYKLVCGAGSLSEIAETDTTGTITRYVTDKTVCDAPYDGMYIDYILAKINMYQRDMTAYNQHIMAFNSRLAAYKNWVNEHSAKDEGKFKNWW